MQFSMRSRWLAALIIALIVVVGLAYLAVPYARAASLFVRAANLGGRVEAFADARAREVRSVGRRPSVSRPRIAGPAARPETSDVTRTAGANAIPWLGQPNEIRPM